jgi:beta-N-acetylhexosaminidase
MIMVGFRGQHIHDAHPIARDIREYHIGGVILFDYDVNLRQPCRNINNPEQLRRLTTSLQAITEIPLCIAIDQEGGQVARLKAASGFPPTVSARELGHQHPVSSTAIHAERIAHTLKEAGITTNFAPVVDLDRNPVNPVIGKCGRSFSHNPDRVTAHARAWIEQHHAQGIMCAVKHFPGHGSSQDDSHHGWVDVTNLWSAEELQPYQRLISSGLCDMVMTAHIFHAHLDPEWPATLSHSIITGILREQLRYDGVVVSDDLQMQAIHGRYSLSTILQKAVHAGVDILTFGNNVIYDEEIVLKIIPTMTQLVTDGVIRRERIEQSYQRILRLKEGYGMMRPASKTPDTL